MRYTVTKQIIQVVGLIWMPSTPAAMDYTLTPYDMENIGDPLNRNDVEKWVLTHSGNFSRIIDFRADFTIGDNDIVHDWNNPESELTYNDCMFGDNDYE